MRLKSESFEHNQPIPRRCAFGIPHATEHLTLGENRNPHLSWTGIPDKTESLVLICTDIDVPSSMDNFNKEGRTIDSDLPRVNFIHWVMVDIPAVGGSVAEGQCSNEITPGGKSAPHGPPGSRQGKNDYTGFMADNPDMRGDYLGYDGPCPPWNDERLHHYHFVLYATDLPRCPVEDSFTATDVLEAIGGHILASAELVGTYTLNPDLSQD
jgi:Raf kinase inhibitor-like YbhB/YbcL family protein